MPLDDFAEDRITIKPRELYDTLRRLEGKVDLLATREATIQDHESRIRKLEGKFVGIAVSAVATVVLGVPVLIWRLTA